VRSNRSSRVQSLLNDLLDESRRHHTDNRDKLDKIRTEILQAIDQADSSRGASIREAFANIRTYCLELVREGEKLNKSQRVLRSLKCTTLRESAIKEAYWKTFEWIFSERVFEREKRPSFLQWLRQGDGIYWISGKAGSGKSTLMKLLCDNGRTKKLLRGGPRTRNSL
jgi:ATPase subunit of ABC transporter with duplicated ATPase domains